MSKNYVICGMQFGDEGKGTFVGYLAREKNINITVKYNGGAEASHTVISDEGVLHQFAQLGSSMFSFPKTGITYLTSNTVINFHTLWFEVAEFAGKTNQSTEEVFQRVFVNENCYIVTPYHKLINRLRELLLGEKGVGTGVSEVLFLAKTPEFGYKKDEVSLKVSDIASLYKLSEKLLMIRRYVEHFFLENIAEIEKLNLKEIFSPAEYILLENLFFLDFSIELVKYYMNVYRFFKERIYSDDRLLIKENDKCIFEGTQGLLIDKKYGTRPNTTPLDTTNQFAVKMLRGKSYTLIGIAKCFCSRHGVGAFPTENYEVSSMIFDKNQSETFWNGKMRYGWFDAVLFRYAQRINSVDEVYLSCIDKLDSFSKIKVCNSYIYSGSISPGFEQNFEYHTNEEGEIIIDNIIAPTGLGPSRYLKKCIPIYIEIDGWECLTKNIRDVNDIPIRCFKYIKMLEKLIGVRISVVSFGPTASDKIRM